MDIYILLPNGGNSILFAYHLQPQNPISAQVSLPPPFHLHSIRNALRYFLTGAILKPCTAHSAAETQVSSEGGYMKTRILMALAALSTALLWFTVALQAQTTEPRLLLKVDVPFEFVVGGMNLPAGQYHVLHIINPNWILLRSTDGRAKAVVYVQVSATTVGGSSSKLVFNRYGEQYFLSQVWTGQDNEVHECFKSSAERTLAGSSPKLPEVATVYAKP
jgi:hypothetical protein